MNTENVISILGDRKIHTRRVVKPQPKHFQSLSTHDPMQLYRTSKEPGYQLKNKEFCMIGFPAMMKECPYGKIGDRLWVRETWKINGWPEELGFGIKYKDEKILWRDCPDIEDDIYERYSVECSDECDNAGIKIDPLTEEYDLEGKECPTRWRPSIFMPRWASRITLEITNIKVEKLQDISPEDCAKEGIVLTDTIEDKYRRGKAGISFNELIIFRFLELWDRINKKTYPWDSNPWVWVIEFKVIKKGENK